jgi:hypothetical protein
MSMTYRGKHPWPSLRRNCARSIFWTKSLPTASTGPTDVRLTATLHKLFCSGCAMISPDNRNVAILTGKGREVLAARLHP